jgi:ribonuclease/clavin/mitogillin
VGCSGLIIQGTNTYLIGKGPKRVLIDTGEGKPAWIETVQKVLDDEKAQLESVILTHWHPDHVGGVKDILQLSPKPTVYKNTPAQGQTNIENGQKFIVDGATLKAFHCPGHTQDHMALILEEEGAMFTGDNVLGHGTAVFEDLPQYLRSLAAMREAVSETGKGYPGHGAVIEDCRGKITEYIKHRETREREVIEVLGRGTEGEGLGSMDLVRIIYQDVPENLHFAASRGVVQILEKLVGEGKVHFHEEAGTWSLERKAVL